MSEENIEVLRRFIDASNRRDLTAALSCCDPDIELDFGRILIGTPTYRGHRGVERWFHDMAAAWEELQAELPDVVAVGVNELVCVNAAAFGKGKTTGVPFAAPPSASVVRFNHGKVLYAKMYATKAEALEAAGLQE